MNAYTSAREIEAEGMRMLKPWLVEHADGKIIFDTGGKGALSKFLQENMGDLLLHRSARPISIEVKIEQDYAPGTRNLFLETWSNRNLDSVRCHAERGSNLGWLYKLHQADFLFYLILQHKELHIMRMVALQRWCFGYRYEDGGDLKEAEGKVYRYRERPQGIRSQLNDTWGRPVPVVDLQEQLKPPLHSLFLSQLPLPGLPEAPVLSSAGWST